MTCVFVKIGKFVDVFTENDFVIGDLNCPAKFSSIDDYVHTCYEVYDGVYLAHLYRCSRMIVQYYTHITK
jgi:hypothetical protein